MKIPRNAPSFLPLVDKVDKAKMSQIIELAKLVDEKGRYLHWEQLRHKIPPLDLSSEEWWLSFRFARKSAAQQLPFEDTNFRKFYYTEPPEIKALLRFVDMNAAGSLGTLGQQVFSIEDGKRYLRRSLAEEPFASSLIEGAVTTREIAKKMIFEAREPRTRDERMVLNNYNGMEFVKEIRDEEITPAHILELHRIITEGTLDNPDGSGRLRSTDDDIAVVDDTSGDILHKPPNAIELPDRLQKLCDFANMVCDDSSYFHPLIRGMTLHFMLAYDHPFVDGNGRTARALFYWMLMRENYWLMEYTSISSVIADHPHAYYRAFLYSETDEGDLTYFFLHQARVIKDALQRMHDYADDKRKEFQKFQKVVQEQNLKNPLNTRQIALVQELSLGRGKNVLLNEYLKLNNISYLTARNDLEDLVERGLLRKLKKGRMSLYVPTDKIGQGLVHI